MMLDICVPIFHKNLKQFLSKHVSGLEAEMGFTGTLRDIEEFTGVPFRLLVMVDGGMRDDFADLEAYLGGADYEWKIIHERQPIYYAKAMVELLAVAKAKIIAVIPPNVALKDPKWFGKMQLVFLRDPRAAVVYANQVDPCSLPPQRIFQHEHPGEPMLILQKYMLDVIDIQGDEVDAGEWSAQVSKQALAYGSTRWVAPGVRRFILGGVSHGCRSSEEVRSQ